MTTSANSTGQHHVLVIGVGSIGERHVRCFQSTGRTRISICEINEGLRHRVADRYNIEHHFDSLEQALTLEYDAAVVAVPAHLHVPISQQVAEAGIHLLIEKPLSVSLEGIEKLSQTITSQNLVAAVAYVTRAHPGLSAMRKAIASGRWGAPVELVAVSGQHFPTYRPAYREIYYRDRAMGGGAIQDALTHTLNTGEWLVGPIDRLVADASHQVLAGVEVEDTVHLLARQGNVLASYSLNQYQAPNENTITVVCQQGTVRFEYHQSSWSWMVDGEWHSETIESLERDTLFVYQADAFLDAMEGSVEPLCTLDEGLRTLHANLAALKSAAHAQWVDLHELDGIE